MEQANGYHSDESTDQKRDRCERIIDGLIQHYGMQACTLDYSEDAWKLLVGGILATQCTDERVNRITPELFQDFPGIEEIAASSPPQIEPYIKSCGLFRNKAKNIHGSAVKILSDFAGDVPRTREDLMTLPGVGRKIANLLLGDVFGQQAIVVDTHCGRISRLLGLSEHKDPLRVERDLMDCVPHKHWTDWGHLMVAHGREICVARRPQCGRCPVRKECATGVLYTGPLDDSDNAPAVLPVGE